MSIGGTIKSSILALIPFYLVQITGLAMVKFGVIDRKGFGTLSQLINKLFLPCMSFVTLGSQLSIERLEMLWVIIVVGIIVLVGNLLFSWLFIIPIAQPCDSMRDWILMALSFQNMVAMPLLFIEGTCHNVEFRGADGVVIPREVCKLKGQLFIFMYAMVPSFVVFVVNSYIELKMERINNSAVTDVEQPNATPAVSSAISLGSTTDLESAVNPAATNSDSSFRHKGSVKKSSISIFQITKRVLQKPPMWGQFAGMFVGLVPFLQDLFFSQTSYMYHTLTQVPLLMAPGFTPLANIVVAASMGLKLVDTNIKEYLTGGNTQVSGRTLIGLCVGRLLVLPSVTFGIVYGLQQTGIIPNNELLRFFVLFINAFPSANIVVLVAHFSGFVTEAENIALTLVIQYGACALTLPLWCTLSLLASSVN